MQGSFESVCLSDLASQDDVEAKAAAITNAAIVFMSLHPKKEQNDILWSGQAHPVLDMLLNTQLPWSRLLQSRWPVFRILALTHIEFRRHQEREPMSQLINDTRPEEGCSSVQEEDRETALILSVEGRRAKPKHIPDSIQAAVASAASSPSAFHAYLEELLDGEEVKCHASAATAFAQTADALQCHWHRNRTKFSRDMAFSAVNIAQALAQKAFVFGAQLLTSRWPLLQYLSRLEVGNGSDDDAFILISWSNRETEKGGFNVAERFAQEVFGDLPNVVLKPDMECSDILIFQQQAPNSGGGVLIFLDGESSPAKSGNVEELLSTYPASIVVGPRSPGGKALHYPVPYASTHFGSRGASTPADLLKPRSLESLGRKRRFAAYVAFKCWPHREDFYRLLDSAAKAAGLGGVDTLSRCGNSSSANEQQSQASRHSPNYLDEVVELMKGYRFALVFENQYSERYVTEKIVNAFLAGAVPIYWGSSYVSRLFNPEAFIDVGGFESSEAAVDRVIQIALDEAVYARYATAAILRNTTEALWTFSWHRSVAFQVRHSLREEIAQSAMQLHRESFATGGAVPAVETRAWDYASLFPP